MVSCSLQGLVGCLTYIATEKMHYCPVSSKSPVIKKCKVFDIILRTRYASYHCHDVRVYS